MSKTTNYGAKVRSYLHAIGDRAFEYDFTNLKAPYFYYPDTIAHAVALLRAKLEQSQNYREVESIKIK